LQQFIPGASQCFAKAGGNSDRGVHLTSLNLLKVAAADIRLLRKLFLRCRKPHAQATNVFAKLLLRFDTNVPS
jgi:hypothetical protein